MSKGNPSVHIHIPELTKEQMDVLMNLYGCRYAKELIVVLVSAEIARQQEAGRVLPSGAIAPRP